MARIQLWNAAIYSILKYGVIAILISEEMQIKIQQFPSKRIRSIVETNEQEENETNDWGGNRLTNFIMRKQQIPTIQSELYSGELCDIYRWYATKESTYLNNQNSYRADIAYLEMKCNRIKQIITAQQNTNY